MVRYVCAAVLAGGLTACQTVPPRPPPPVPEVVQVCSLPDLPERPSWLFLAPDVGTNARVRELGGTNCDLYTVYRQNQAEAVACGDRLRMAEKYVEQLEEIINASRR